MQFDYFRIRNFKGIRELSIYFDHSPSSPVITLVGLNESGKTTILEALSFFYENLVDSDKEITLHNVNVANIESLIPKRLKTNFNGQISFEAGFTIEDSDFRIIKAVSQRNDFIAKDFDEELVIKLVYNFKDSRYQDKKSYWDFEVMGRFAQGKVRRELFERRIAWNPVVNALKEQIPTIIYYPNFLFEFPDIVYLTEVEGEKPEQVFYRKLIQDILDTFENGLTIDDHLIKRAASKDYEDKEPLQSVVDRIGSQITSIVLDPNLSILGDSPIRREIRVSTPSLDSDKDAYFIEIKLKDGDDSYFIRERSLGFRWIFTFLMFTKFRVLRVQGKQKTLFLFDEPATNLHQTAQQRLLQAFSDLVQDSNTRIIYTTHSHHLIEPNWLESTYIVQNKALTYENDSTYSSALTDIIVEKYRSFVSKHPDQKTYFQPILDVLEYRPSNLESVPDVVMVEGKNDFYTLSYLNEIIFGNRFNLNFLPGGGAGSLDGPIQLYYAWGRNFHVLLDSDAEGRSQKKRYFDKFGKIVEGKVHTIGDLVPDFSNLELEDIFHEEDRLNIQSQVETSSQMFHKKKFNLAIQECLICKRELTLSQATISGFERLLSELQSLIQES